MGRTGIYILGHQGIGDHILCSGIYREFAKNYTHCVIPVYRENHFVVSDLLKDVKNIQVLPYMFRTELWEMKMEVQRDLLKKFGYDALNLGHHGKNFFTDKLKRLDANYYDQANLALSARWDSFYYQRNPAKEDELYRLFNCDEEKYIFVHDDVRRNFVISEDRLPTGIRVVRPDLELSKGFSFFDYLKIIENASEIHCMESSFAALIESLEIQVPKFAHRYARPEARADRRHEFTYRSKWEVLL